MNLMPLLKETSNVILHSAMVSGTYLMSALQSQVSNWKLHPWVWFQLLYIHAK